MSINCPSGTIYTVQPGDTMFEIARRHGLTLQELIAANPQVADPDVLAVGQRLCLPGIAPPLPRCPGVIHVVAAGDTLFTLARRYGTTVAEILRFNPGIDPEHLRIGQEICIPVAEPGRRRCVLLFPTDIAPNSEGVAYLNPATGRVIVFVTSVPRPEVLPGGEVYKVYVGQQESDTFDLDQMTECLPGLWVADFRPSFPVPEIQSILVTAELEENVGVPQGLGVAHIILGPPS